VSALADAAGVNLETVRYYERQGLLPKPPRTPAGYRSFNGEAVRRLQFIKQAQALGFSLREIRELLSLRVKPGAPCSEVRDRAQAKLADIDAKLKQLRAMRTALARFVATCSGRGPMTACPILDALDHGRPSQRALHKEGR